SIFLLDMNEKIQLDMLTIQNIESLGTQVPINENIGTYSIVLNSSYFKCDIPLNFENVPNHKNRKDFELLHNKIQTFQKLNEDKLGWMKNILWENCLYAFEGTDYGFNIKEPSEKEYELNLEEIIILTDMPNANLNTIKGNMLNFNIYNRQDAFDSSKLNYVNFKGDTACFNFTTKWDDEHDINIWTENFIYTHHEV
ncbi:MAG: hypothetical protein AAGK97_04435, partial [Bacteroidota bacterium]